VSEREVPMVPEVAEPMKALPRGASDFVFAVKSGLRPVSHSNARTKWFDPMIERARLTDAGLTPHKLRSIAATILAPRLPPATLMRVFGWSDMRTAMRFYVVSSDEMADEARKAMIDGMGRFTR